MLDGKYKNSKAGKKERLSVNAQPLFQIKLNYLFDDTKL
jgi:hypothetical protein